MSWRLAYSFQTNWPGRTPRLLLASIVAALGLLPAACESEQDRLDAIAAASRSAPAQAAADLVVAFRSGKVRHDRAIHFATERLQDGHDETAFAGAVLEALKGIGLKTGAEFELFWLGVGRLAFWGAYGAYSRGRVEEARALVFGGPSRWQTEAYWLMYPDHDALASYILADSGERSEAVRRLRDRSDLEGEAEEALRALERAR